MKRFWAWLRKLFRRKPPAGWDEDTWDGSNWDT